MASGIYNRFKANILNKEVDLEADTLKVMLLNNTHTFDATNNVYADISANELANGNGYTTGGATLANPSVTQAASTKFDANDTTWTSSTFSAYHAVIYDDSLANKDLIASIDFGGEQAVDNGTLTISWDAAGIFTIA